MIDTKYIYWKAWVLIAVSLVVVLVLFNFILPLPALFPIIGDEKVWLELLVNGTFAVVAVIVGCLLQKQYQNDTAVLKSDLTKRTYQYEKKHNTYLDFFSLLDDITSQSKENIQKQNEIIAKFMSDLVVATNNEQATNKAISTYIKNSSTLIPDPKSGIIKIKQTSNAIQLLASQDVQNKLSEYISYIEQVIDENNKIIGLIPNLILHNNQLELQQITDKIMSLGSEAKLKLESLKCAMRKDLDIE